MNLIRTFIVICVAVTILTGCASWFRKESGSQIYEGDSPNIQYIDRESAGGPIGR